MRLVSAYYNEFYPFDTFNIFKEFIASNSPQELKQGDVLLVWGGADIHPSLYRKALSKKSGAGKIPSQRDIVEWEMMQQAKLLNIPIIGVCRGAQMLCALAGGFLYQHVDNHGGTHKVFTESGATYKTNSLHHQMMAIPEEVDHELMAWTESRSGRYFDEDTEVDIKTIKQDPEFVYFPKVKGFAVQWHPEMMSESCEATKHIQQVFMEKINA